VQGREARHRVPGVDVRAAADQHGSRLEAVVPARLRQRGAEVRRPIRIGAVIQQEVDHPLIVVVGGPHQRRSEARRDIRGSGILRSREIIGHRAGLEQ
jgi:hypothetical protein